MSGATANATDVGAIRARMELDASGFNESLSKAKQTMSTSTNEARQVTKQIRDLGKSLTDTGMSAKEMRQIQREIREVKPELLEQELKRVEIQLRKLGASSEMIEKVKQKMREAQQETKESINRVEALSNALIALGAGAALGKLIGEIETLADKANAYINAQRGLEEVSKALGVNVKETIDLVQDLVDRGFLNLAQASGTVKTLLASGLNLDQTKNLILATADAAAYNREAHLSWGEAIEQVAQGVKTGNSELTDAAGITTNLSVMYDRYAGSIGTTADKLSDAQKTLAAYNGIMQESSMYTGNAATAMEGYNGTQAQFSQTIQTAEAELGEAFLPLLQELMGLVIPIIKSIGDWAKEHQGLAVGMAAGTAAVLAITAAVTALVPLIYTLTTALAGLEIALGPIGLAIAAIGLVVGGFAAYTAGASSASQSALEFASSQEILNAKLMQSPLNMQVEEFKKLTASIETLNPIMEKRNALMDDYNKRMALAQSGKGNIDNTHEIYELADAIKSLDKELRGLGFESGDAAADALGRMKEQAKGAAGAQVALEEENVRVVSGQVKHIDAMNKLQKQYEQLSSKEKLSAQQKQQLAQTVEQLKREYPDLLVQLDEEGKWHINNVDALKQLIDAEKSTVDAAAEGSKQRLEIAKNEAQTRIDLLKPQLAAMQALENKPIPEPTVPGLGNFTQDALKRTLKNAIKDTSGQINTAQATVLQAERDVDAITVGNYSIFDKPLPGSATTPDKGKGKGKGKGKTAAEIQQEQYQSSLKYIERKRQLNQMSEADELQSLERLQGRYQKNSEIRQDLEVRVYQLKQQMNKEEKEQLDEQRRKKEEEAKKLTQAQQDQYQTSLKFIDRQRSLNQMSDSEELQALQRLKERYKDNSEIRQELEVRIYQLKEQMGDKEEQHQEELLKESEEAARTKFEASSEWSEQEEKRMRLAGKSEADITVMKLEAWTRVRDRYAKDSEFYKQADNEVYENKIDLMQREEDKQKEIESDRKEHIKQASDVALDAIEREKQAELDALDERRKEIEHFYDGQKEAIDDSERVIERKALIADLEKYRLATSEQGKQKYKELQDKLRQMDNEDEKRKLDKERQDKLDDLEQKKDDIESWYDDLKQAFVDYSGDMKPLYQLLEDERFKVFSATNAKIRAELAALASEYARLSSAVGSSSGTGITDTGTASSSTSSSSSNSQGGGGVMDTGTATATTSSSSSNTGRKFKDTLANGAVWSPEAGGYVLDGRVVSTTPVYYHTGGIAGQVPFRIGDKLMPDELHSILRMGEVTLTPKQVGSLVASTQNQQAAPIINNYNAPLVQHSGDVRLEDQADIQSYWGERDAVAQRMLARGERL
ncbi:hypothetical protein [Paenibacillus sp. OV219]|uniref:hypothetical protein n=1 Tax=Paenibacillus sp. OV219 TaxID=1884377 RepID=UPI0008CE31FD|nr:hypothetical protein [Paenibacillus sp. OV219]SEM81921.1 Chromosome segregation ATPase [Paenibacillus sp. OV219]